MRLSVIGLGRLGAPMAAVLADAGHDVVGMDTHPGIVRSVAAAQAPVSEPFLQQTMDRCRARLAATSSIAEATASSDVTFVVVPTPSLADGSFSLEFVLDAVAGIGAALAPLSGHRHVVVITSTVMPGSTDGPIRSALESASGRTVGVDIGLCYSPEFIALGSVMHDIRNPDMVLVGESDPAAGDALAEALSAVVQGNPPVLRMTPVNAEIAKLAVNTFVTTKISYANMLSEICDRIPGADVDVVTRTIGLDARIGARYLNGGTPYGGPCFPRDNAALGRMAASLGVAADIATATQAVNLRQVRRIADAIASHVETPSRVAILGLSYKPGTSVADESAGVALARFLTDAGHDVVVFDPEAMPQSTRLLGSSVEFGESLESAVNGAAVIVITTAWPEFAALPLVLSATQDPPPVVIDCWGILDPAAVPSRARVVRPGAPGRS